MSKQDTQRLTWIQKHADTIERQWNYDTHGKAHTIWFVNLTDEYYEGDTLRQAIDQAMKGRGK